MRSILTLAFTLCLAACGDIKVGELDGQANGKETGSETAPVAQEPVPEVAPATEPAVEPAPAPAPAQEVTVKVEVEVTTATTPEREHELEAKLHRFASGAYAWFRGDVYAYGEGWRRVENQDIESPAYCWFEAPNCAGGCIADRLPVKDSLFSPDGKTFLLAIETEIDRGRQVVASAWRNGHCEEQTMTLQHSYRPKITWTMDPGETVSEAK